MDRLPCSHCGALVDAGAGVECAVCGAPLDLAAIAVRAATDAQAHAMRMVADSEEPVDHAAEAQATALRMAEEAEVMARAAAEVAPHSRLSCRHCGAFVDQTASPQCPVCLEPTGDAIPAPWIPPAEPDEDREASPMQVSAIRIPEAVSSAAEKRKPQRETPRRADRLTAESIVPAVDAPPRNIPPVRAVTSSVNAPESAAATPARVSAFSPAILPLFVFVAAASFLAGAAAMFFFRH